ncbi:GH39 family glycosyl hydrolase [Compostibacter hankyongensis]|uniref:Glycosyl hydrolases family 39 N-terminal catalytic domain-containing protein n=1 Tax=Compostibacter hankyongensis TaxID=1007089 RepID=A0ABP8FF79_9BACT
MRNAFSVLVFSVFMVKAIFALSGPVTAPASTVISDTLPVLADWPLDGRLRSRSAREIASSDWSIGGETLDRDYADYHSYKPYLGPLGAKRIRLQGGWAKCEKVKGRYDFSWLDSIIPDAFARGVRPWVELSYGNPIYEGGGEAKLAGRIPTSPEGLRAWDNWVKAIVSRYKNQVAEWEIWNEPDLNAKNQGDEFADFYIRTARMIRSVQPEARLWALGMAGVPALRFLGPFMERLREKNALDLIDVLTYHGYAPNPDDSYPKIEQMRKFVWKYNPRIKFMQGENGAPSTPAKGTVGALTQFDWTELSQAKWDLRRMLGDHGRGIATNVFTISDVRYGPGDHLLGLNTKGLLKTNPDKTIDRPKLSYYAVQHVMSLFDDRLELVPGAGITAEGPDISVFHYRRRSSHASLITLWNHAARPSEAFIPVAVSVTVTGKFTRPVLVDLISGKVYRIPADHWKRSGRQYRFTGIPVPDYPVVIADKSALYLKK